MSGPEREAQPEDDNRERGDEIPRWPPEFDLLANDPAYLTWVKRTEDEHSEIPSPSVDGF